jgi:hypothetical protein
MASKIEVLLVVILLALAATNVANACYGHYVGVPGGCFSSAEDCEPGETCQWTLCTHCNPPYGFDEAGFCLDNGISCYLARPYFCDQYSC